MSMMDFIGCHVLIPDLWTICQPIRDLTITCYTLNRLLKEYSVESENRKKLYEEGKQLPSRLNSEFQYSWISINVKKKSTSIYTPFTVLVLKNQHLIETPVFLIVKLICCDWMSWPFKPFIHCKVSYIYFIHLS